MSICTISQIHVKHQHHTPFQSHPQGSPQRTISVQRAERGQVMILLERLVGPLAPEHRLSVSRVYASADRSGADRYNHGQPSKLCPRLLCSFCPSVTLHLIINTCCIRHRRWEPSTRNAH